MKQTDQLCIRCNKAPKKNYLGKTKYCIDCTVDVLDEHSKKRYQTLKARKLTAKTKRPIDFYIACVIVLLLLPFILIFHLAYWITGIKFPTVK